MRAATGSNGPLRFAASELLALWGLGLDRLFGWLFGWLLGLDRRLRFSGSSFFRFGSGSLGFFGFGLGSGFLSGRLLAHCAVERLLTGRRKERKPDRKRHERKRKDGCQPGE